MAKEVRGFVRRVFRKDGTGRNGKPYSLFSFKIATPEGQEDATWYQLGFDEPKVKADWADDKYGDGGSYVKFSCEPAADGKSAKVDESTLKRLKNPPARKPVQAPQGGGGGKGGYGNRGGGGPKEKDSKLFGKIGGYNTEDDVRRMSYSNARGDAIAAVELLLTNDALPITGAKTKAGQAKRFDEIVAAIDKLTVKFFFDNASGRQLTLVADSLVKMPSAASLPDDQETVEDEADESDDDAEQEDEEAADEDEEAEETDESDEEDSDDEVEDEEDE